MSVPYVRLISRQVAVRSSRRARTEAGRGKTYPPVPARCSHRTSASSSDQPGPSGAVEPFTRSAARGSRSLRFSTTVSAVPASAVMPEPTQAMTSSRQDQLLRPCSVLPKARSFIPYAPSVVSGSAVPPAQSAVLVVRCPAASAGRPAMTVVPGSLVGSTVGQ